MAAPASKAAKFQAALHEATVHYQAGRLADAEKVCRRALRDQPSNAEINSALAIILKDQGKLADVEAAFRRVAAVTPNSPAAHNNLGTILFAQHKLPEAEASIRRALALQPDMTDALKNLGLVIVDRGGATESVPWFRRHAELAYNRPESAGREPILPHKAQHDQEQRDYVNGGNGGRLSQYHLEDGARVDGPAIALDASGGEIAKKNGRPKRRRSRSSTIC